MTNEKLGNGPLKACARQLLRTKRKTRARRDTIWLRALIASKNALKAPMEGAHKKNRKGERTNYTADPARRFRATRGCRPYASGPDVALARSDATGQGGSGGKPRTSRTGPNERL